jgi:hypothetical protein
MEYTVHDVCSVPYSDSCYCVLFAVVSFESMRAFMYGHDIIIRDQPNVINIEWLFGSTKQMRINDLLKTNNENWTWQWK